MSGTSGRARSSNGPTFDLFDNTPELIPLRTAARSEDWNAVRAFFSGLDSVDKVSVASGAVANVWGTETYLEQAAVDRPADPLPRTLLAERYIRLGWKARSAARAQHVTPEQFKEFHAWLRKAEALLISAARAIIRAGSRISMTSDSVAPCSLFVPRLQ